MPTLSIGIRRPRGFTFLEALVVLVLLGLVAALTVPRIDRLVGREGLATIAREIANGCRLARARAVARQEDAVVAFDLSSHRVRIDGVSTLLSIPESAAIELTTVTRESSGAQQGGFRFYPDGTNTGGQVRLHERDFGFVIDLDWLTGDTRIYAE